VRVRITGVTPPQGGDLLADMAVRRPTAGPAARASRARATARPNPPAAQPPATERRMTMTAASATTHHLALPCGWCGAAAGEPCDLEHPARGALLSTGTHGLRATPCVACNDYPASDGAHCRRCAPKGLDPVCEHVDLAPPVGPMIGDLCGCCRWFRPYDGARCLRCQPSTAAVPAASAPA